MKKLKQIIILVVFIGLISFFSKTSLAATTQLSLGSGTQADTGVTYSFTSTIYHNYTGDQPDTAVDYSFQAYVHYCTIADDPPLVISYSFLLNGDTTESNTGGGCTSLLFQMLSIGETCTSNTDCSSSNCVSKPSGAKVCVAADKECADSSGNGVDTSYTECYVGDFYECTGLDTWVSTDCANNCGFYSDVNSCSAGNCQACGVSCSSHSDCDSNAYCSTGNECLGDHSNNEDCSDVIEPDNSGCSSAYCYDDDWDGAGEFCAASSTSCVFNGTSYSNGYELCSVNDWFKTCSSGTWGSEISCDLADDYCDAGSGAQSGYGLAETCLSSSVGGCQATSCISCEPYMADSVNSCKTSCLAGDDCWSGYECDAGVCEVPNIAPEMQTSRIYSVLNATADNLEGYCNAIDTDSGNIIYYYEWYRNDVLNISGNTVLSYDSGLEINVDNISSSDLVVGDNWILSCSAYDSENNSDWLNSSSLTIKKCGTMLNVTNSIIINSSQSSTNYDCVYVQDGGTLILDVPFEVNNEMIVYNGGTVTHSSNTNAQVNWLNMTVANLTIESGGSIDVTKKGYSNSNGPGQGIDGSYPGGGGYGGNGGDGSGTAVGGSSYGSLTQPVDLGSGSGGNNVYNKYVDGHGGGAVKLDVSGTLIIDGSIIANGGKGYTPANWGVTSGGSGGSIWIDAGTLSGSGSIKSNGGSGGSTGSQTGSGGGGGRIAIYFTSSSFSGVTTVYGGSGTQYGGAGTIYTKQTGTNGDLLIDNNNHAGAITNLTVGTHNFDNFNITSQHFIIPSSTSLNIQNHANMHSGTKITASGTVSINTANILDSVNYDGLLEATTVNILSTGTLTHSANSDSKNYYLDITAENFTIESGGSINVTGKGYSNSNGPGQGTDGNTPGGGGYGGDGGDGSGTAFGGSSYGSLTHPADLGSGSGGNSGYNYYFDGHGGGAVKLDVSDTLIVEGSIIANGGTGYVPANYGTTSGGSGGSIWIDAGTFSGSGSIVSKGGAGGSTSYQTASGGGGGRIAIYYTIDSFTGNTTSNGGSGYQEGNKGSIFRCDYISSASCSGISGSNVLVQSGSVNHITSYSINESIEINRTIINPYSSNSLNWTDSSSNAACIATYNLTGLNPLDLLNILDNGIEIENSPLNTDANGILSIFSVNLTSEHEISISGEPAVTNQSNGESCTSNTECNSTNCVSKPDSSKVCAAVDKECADSLGNGVDTGYKECYNSDSYECTAINTWISSDCTYNCGLYADVDSCSAGECQACETSCALDNDCDAGMICSVDNTCINENDLDNDGISNDDDAIHGDENYVNVSGIISTPDLNITIDNDKNISKIFTGTHDIMFKDKDVCLVFFRHDFSDLRLNLSKIEIHKGAKGMHIKGLSLGVGKKKTVCVSAPEQNNLVCLKDDEEISLDDMTDDCTGDGEILFDSCSASGQTIGEYYCYYNTTYGVYLINSTSHTGAKELGNARLEIWDDTDFGTKNLFEGVVFYANYTNLSSGEAIVGADCNIWFDNWANWSDMSADNIHNFTRSFETFGTKNWNVSCSATGFTSINTNDTVVIGSGAEIPEFSVVTVMLALSVILCGLLFMKRKR
ncbi:MAG: hypothetical protein U9R34_06685 [Nanoarchaeota archaeon]|nr:hypothetical protein [Nanoarchaeota archaeon]